MKRFYRHMNPTIAAMIREMYFARLMKQQELADFFRISQTTVCRVISGEVWT